MLMQHHRTILRAPEGCQGQRISLRATELYSKIRVVGERDASGTVYMIGSGAWDLDSLLTKTRRQIVLS